MSQDGNWIETELWDKVRISEEDLGGNAVMGDFHVTKVSAYVPVSEELLTDVNATFSTEPVFKQPQPWHLRLRWTVRWHWWELRTRLALAIGGGEVTRSDECE